MDRKFSPRWAAPEVLTRRKFSKFSDVWSFGVTVWEIFEYCKKIPFWKYLDSQVYDIIENTGASELPQPKKCPDQIWKFIEKCWLTQPSARPSFQVLNEQLNSCLLPTNNTNNNNSGVENKNNNNNRSTYNN